MSSFSLLILPQPIIHSKASDFGFILISFGSTLTLFSIQNDEVSITISSSFQNKVSARWLRVLISSACQFSNKLQSVIAGSYFLSLWLSQMSLIVLVYTPMSKKRSFDFIMIADFGIESIYTKRLSFIMALRAN